MLEIKLEEEIQLPYENCCFCRKPSPYWTTIEKRSPGEQVCICRRCAEYANENDVPSKKEWCRRERIAMHQFY